MYELQGRAPWFAFFGLREFLPFIWIASYSESMSIIPLI
jgi:hypothetical protein